jgi:antitoxin ParD1/3/4
MATLNVSLPEAMRVWIDAQVSSGNYVNASDYVRHLIRHDQREREVLTLALIEAEQSGHSARTVAGIRQDTKARLKNG